MTHITLLATIKYRGYELDAKVTCDVTLGYPAQLYGPIGDRMPAEPGEVKLVEYAIKGVDTASLDFESKYFHRSSLSAARMRNACDNAVAEWLLSNEQLFLEEALLDRDNL